MNQHGTNPRNYIPPPEIGRIHAMIALSNLSTFTDDYTNVEPLIIEEPIEFNSPTKLYQDIVINNNGHLKISCEMELPEGSLITVYYGGTLELINEGQLINNQNNRFSGNIIIKNGGKLIVNQNEFELAEEGIITINSGGILNCDTESAITGSGTINLRSATINSNSGANLTIESNSKTNPMLYVNGRTNFDSDFNSITFKNGKIVMQNTSSQLYLPNGIDALTIDNVTVTTQNGTYLNCNGITANNTPNVLLKNSTFEKMKYGFFSSVVPSSEFLTIQNCSFKYCKYGLYLYNGGVDISNSTFNNNQVNGIYSRSMDANSHFNNVHMNSNGSYGLYYTGSSTADANMDYSSASNNQDGLHLEGGI